VCKNLLVFGHLGTRKTGYGVTTEKSGMWSFFLLSAILVSGVKAWTSEIHGRVVCDVCGDSSVGPEDKVLEGLSLISPSRSLIWFCILA